MSSANSSSRANTSTSNSNSQADARDASGFVATGSTVSGGVVVNNTDQGAIQAAAAIAGDTIQALTDGTDRAYDSVDKLAQFSFEGAKDVIKSADDFIGGALRSALESNNKAVQQSTASNSATVARVSDALNGFGQQLTAANRTSTQDVLEVVKPLGLGLLFVIGGSTLLKAWKK